MAGNKNRAEAFTLRKPMFRCPVCGEALRVEDGSLKCENRHCYDVAKQGYVNLLRSQQSSDRRHGDDRLMVASRTAFLEKGYYLPLAEAVCAAAAENASPEGHTALLDAGCGECWYTRMAQEKLIGAGDSPEVCGIDISRDALIAGARRGGGLQLAVASLSDIPLPDRSIDIILNIFAPEQPREFFRVLGDGGALIKAIPLERHLWELKCAVYDEPYENIPELRPPEGFRLREKREIKYRITLEDPADIAFLFMMTPYYYKTSAADQAKLSALTRLETAAEFGLLVFEKDE